MSEITKQVTISVDEYQDLVTKCADLDSLHAIASHVSSETAAYLAMKAVLGIWGGEDD